MMGAFTEAALMIAEADDIEMAKREAENVMTALFSRLRGQLSITHVKDESTRSD